MTDIELINLAEASYLKGRKGKNAITVCSHALDSIAASLILLTRQTEPVELTQDVSQTAMTRDSVELLVRRIMDDRKSDVPTNTRQSVD